MQAEERVMLHTGPPQVLTRPVAGHREANQVLQTLILQVRERRETGERQVRDR